MNTNHVDIHPPVAVPVLLDQPIAEIPPAFGEMETLRKKGPLTGLPDILLTLRDVRAVVKYNSFRGRITLTAPQSVEIRVPFTLVDDVDREIRQRSIFGTRVRVLPLSALDHVLLWRVRVRSLVPT